MTHETRRAEDLANEQALKHVQANRLLRMDAVRHGALLAELEQTLTFFDDESAAGAKFSAFANACIHLLRRLKTELDRDSANAREA